MSLLSVVIRPPTRSQLRLNPPCPDLPCPSITSVAWLSPRRWISAPRPRCSCAPTLLSACCGPMCWPAEWTVGAGSGVRVGVPVPAVESAVTVLRDNGAAAPPSILVWREGQPEGWPSSTSRTVGLGSHPKDRSVAEDPRSGLTAAGDRARGRRAASAARAFGRRELENTACKMVGSPPRKPAVFWPNRCSSVTPTGRVAPGCICPSWKGECAVRSPFASRRAMGR